MLDVDGLRVELRRGPVKSVRLGVRPDGSVRLSAPSRAPEQRLRDFVREHRQWLVEQKDRQDARRAPADHLRHGGRVRLWGRWLEVVREHGIRAGAQVREGRVHIVAPDDAAAERAVERLRRREIGARVEAIAPALEQRVGRAPVAYRYRMMVSRWGTCNVVSRHITLNTWLVQRPPDELEYVLVHELAHLVERGHGPRFRAVMDAALPGWRGIRERLQSEAPPQP